MAIDCLQFDGKMQVLQQAECDGANSEQKWVLDIATYMFRYASDVTLCLDYMEDEESFSAEPCHDKRSSDHPRAAFRAEEPRQVLHEQPAGRVCDRGGVDV